jgi:hypothetical protein
VIVEEKNEAVEEFKKDHREGIGDITFTPAEEAAARFTYLLPFLKRMAGSMSSKGMARVIHRLAEFPLGDAVHIDKMGFRTKEEKKLFEVFYNINECKNTILKSMKEDQIKAEQEAQGENVDGNTVETQA